MEILIAEDDKDLAETYFETLLDRGHKTKLTYDGQQCLDRYEIDLQNHGESFYDVVIIDYSLPTKNGLELAKEILKENPKQRIIFVSGYSQNLIPGLKELNGKIELLTKPCGIQFFIDLVEQRKNSLKEKLEQKRLKRVDEMDTERFSSCDIDDLSEMS